MPTRIGAAALAAGTVVGVLTPAVTTSAASTVAVRGNVPSFAKAANRVGGVSGTAKLTISVNLTPSNYADLRRLAHDVSTPGTRSYRHYLTPAQFHSRFSPSASTVSAVKDFLTKAGLKVNRVAPSRLYVDATGTVGQVKKAFDVSQARYRFHGQTVRANAEAPRVPASLAGKVLYVSGLTSLRAKRTAQAPTPTAPALPCNTNSLAVTVHSTPGAHQYGSTQPAPYCGLTPEQIRTAYGLPADWHDSDFTGRGVTVAVTDAFADPYQPTAVNRFSANHGLPPVDLTQYVNPGTWHFPENGHFDAAGWYGEEALDLIAVHAIAPEAKLIYVGSLNSINAVMTHMTADLVDSDRADIITNSWGIDGEQDMPSAIKFDQIVYMQAAIQGISMLFSSGDDGDVGATTGVAQGSWPASSDFVTAVGGTSELPGTGQRYGWGTYFSNFKNPTLTQTSPTTYSVTADDLPWPPEFLFGSGGGPSRHIAQPDYQKGVVGDLGDSAATYGADGAVNGSVDYASPRRVVPDVAMDGDPYTGMLFGEVYTKSSDPLENQNQDGTSCEQLQSNLEYCEEAIGGTSLASPLFAGVLALVDQARFDNGKSRLGFANPVLYANRTTAFEDVLPPTAPLGFIRLRTTSDALSARFVTVNSTVTDGTSAPIYGADTSLRTTPGYDNVTGIGAPNVPALITALH